MTNHNLLSLWPFICFLCIYKN